jgi:hypothetical protein
MKTSQRNSRQKGAGIPKPNHSGDVRRDGSTKALLAGTAGIFIAVLLTGCSTPSGGSGASSITSETAAPTPLPTPIASTPCSAAGIERQASDHIYICTADEAGYLIWLEASKSKELSETLAAAAAAKAAEEKASADQAAAEATAKAAKEKVAADKAAAAATAEAAKVKAEAEAKAAQEAAAAQTEAEAAEQASPPAAQFAPPPAAPVAPACDPNYSGCVPIASDVDCAGGSGNGPAYVKGPVRVIGSDIYGLDGKDNDGIGCEG